MFRLVRLRVAVYRLGIGGLDAWAVAHRDGVVGGSLSEVRLDVAAEKSVGRARAGQEQVASELRFARSPAGQQDVVAVPCKRVLGQFAVRSCGAAARPALHWVPKLPVEAAEQRQAESAQLESLAR